MTEDSSGTNNNGDRDREKARAWIAGTLIGALVVVVVGTFVFVIWMSARAEQMSTDELISVLQSIGTTLLAPLIGVIGAVIGFYFGGQAAVQGAQTATQAVSQGAQQSTEAGTQTTRAVREAARDITGQTSSNEPGAPAGG